MRDVPRQATKSCPEVPMAAYAKDVIDDCAQYRTQSSLVYVLVQLNGPRVGLGFYCLRQLFYFLAFLTPRSLRPRRVLYRMPGVSVSLMVTSGVCGRLIRLRMVNRWDLSQGRRYLEEVSRYVMSQYMSSIS